MAGLECPQIHIDCCVRRCDLRNQLLIADLRLAGHLLGGELVSEDTVLCPGPGHDRQDRSLSVKFDSEAPEGFLTHSFAADDWRVCREHVRQCLHLGVFEVSSNFKRFVQQCCAHSGFAAGYGYCEAERTLPRPCGHKASASVKHQPKATSRVVAFRFQIVRIPVRRCAFIRRVRSSSRVARLSVYPRCSDKWWTSTPTSSAAFIELHYSSMATARPLFTDCRLLRRCWVPAGMLASNCAQTTTSQKDSGIAEGIETALAVIGNFGFRPVWATLSASAMAAFPVLSGVECLTIFADNDHPKLHGNQYRQAGNSAARRARSAGPRQTASASSGPPLRSDRISTTSLRGSHDVLIARSEPLALDGCPLSSQGGNEAGDANSCRAAMVSNVPNGGAVVHVSLQTGRTSHLSSRAGRAHARARPLKSPGDLLERRRAAPARIGRHPPSRHHENDGECVERDKPGHQDHHDQHRARSRRVSAARML